MQRWTWAQVWRRRLERHHLLEAAAAERMLGVVGDVCGIHAQVATTSELSLGVRLNDVTRRDVRRALWQDRTLVKTYGLRGTLHVFATAELGLWLAALRAKAPPREPTRAELDAFPPERRDEMLQAIHDALDGRSLTREELGGEIERRLGPWATEETFPAFTGRWPRWQLALGPAALAGLIVFGPSRGNRVTFVRTDQWIGKINEVDGQAALREVCRRFLAAYGPATHVEFARWFNTPARAGLEVMQSLELEKVDVDGWQAWTLSGDAKPPMETRDHVSLLPVYDVYIVGCHPRSQLIPTEAPAALQKGTAAPFPVVIIDGVVAGLWERQVRGKRLAVRVETFDKLNTPRQAAVDQRAGRVAHVLEMEGADVSFERIQLRAHL